VLVDSKGHILATGYNGRAAGLPHCNHRSEGGKGGEKTYPHACPGSLSPSGTDLDSCEAIHAEANALLQCRDVSAIDTAYVTVSPCVSCTKLLLNTGCRTIAFSEPYAHDKKARELWERAGREWGMHLRQSTS
jgi:dCMP deaminase